MIRHYLYCLFLNKMGYQLNVDFFVLSACYQFDGLFHVWNSVSYFGQMKTNKRKNNLSFSFLLLVLTKRYFTYHFAKPPPSSIIAPNLHSGRLWLFYHFPLKYICIMGPCPLSYFYFYFLNQKKRHHWPCN